MEIEVSLKVRSAIKAKLLELGVHVDDELPDYIMVLVANRRSKPQMESDLELFLSENTQKFTTWLFHVLKKLEQVTLADSIAVLTGKEQASESSQPKSKEKVKEVKDKTKPTTSSGSSKVSDKGKPKAGSQGSEKASQKTGTKGSVNAATSTEVSKKTTEVKSDKKRVEKTVKPGTTTAPKSSEKSTENKVQFKLKNNLVKQTEFDRKQAEAEDRKAEKSGTDGSSQAKISSAEEQNLDPSLHEDILNLGDDEDGDLFGVGEAVPETKTTAKTGSKTEAASDDEEDVEKLRQIALETKSPSRRKLATGNVSALRGMVMNFEKENSNKRKRRGDEESDTKKSSLRSQPRSEISKVSTRESPPKKLRSVVSVTSKKPSEEYDPEQPKIRKLSSVVCVTNAQRPKRDTTSLNTNLILKAMKAVEIDNVKRPLKAHVEESKRRRDDRERDGDKNRGWRIARSPSRSRSKERDRERGRSGVPKDHDYSRHRRDRRDSLGGRSSNRRREERSRSPLQLFTKRGRMSIKDRLGEKQVPRNSNPEGVDEDLTENCYEKEIREMEQDLNIIINVTNIRNEDSEDRQVNIGKDSEKSNEASATSVGEKEKSPVVPSMKTTEVGYKAPNRISIQVMNSSSEESEYSDNDGDNGKDAKEDDESETELVVTVNQDQDIDDLLPPQQQQNEENSQEKKSSEEEPPRDRLTDLRAKLAAITRSSTASYSPLHLQPNRPKPQPQLQSQNQPQQGMVSIQPSSAAYFTPYFYDSLPTMPVVPMMPPLPLPAANTTTCKFWPTCSYGENCKYTHPKCKFGEGCAKRPNCAFKHGSDGFSVTPAFTKPPTKYTGPSATIKKLCHFFPKCHTVDCTFYHPKPCRYGVNCTDSACIHYHPGTGSVGEKKGGGKLPAFHQLKWSRAKTNGNPAEQQATTNIS